MGTISTINGVAEDNIATHNGGTASLYASKNGDTWQHIEPMTATGGTVTTSNFKVHTFTSSGTFTVSDAGSGVTVDYLIIAGGAGGARELGVEVVQED